MKYYYDWDNRVVCVPYSFNNLRAMATDLGIAQGFYKGGHAHDFQHYAMPKKRVEEIQAKCEFANDLQKVIKESTRPALNWKAPS